VGGRGGRRSSSDARNQVEWCLVLDVGILAGRRPTPGDEGWVSLRAAACAWTVEAQYFVRNDGALKLTVDVPASTGVITSHFGLTTVGLASSGERVYFLCPGLPGGPACQARVAMLYWPLFGRQAFACRGCHRLAYRSSQERTWTMERLRQHVYRPMPTAPH
jgi:hypothetical protein